MDCLDYLIDSKSIFKRTGVLANWEKSIRSGTIKRSLALFPTKEKEITGVVATKRGIPVHEAEQQ